MYLRKTIVLVALAALAAAPSALALRPPEEPGPSRADDRAAPAGRPRGEADEAGEGEGEAARVLHAAGPLLLRDLKRGGSLRVRPVGLRRA